MKHLIKLAIVCSLSFNACFGEDLNKRLLVENVEASRHLIAEPNTHLETQVTAKIVEHRRDVYVTPSGVKPYKYDEVKLRIITPYFLQTKEFTLMTQPKGRETFERVGGLISFSISERRLRDVLGGRARWVLWIELKDLKVPD